MVVATPGSFAKMTFKIFMTAAALGACGLMFSGCLVLGAAGAVGGAAVAVTGTAIGVTGKVVSATAHGVGDVAGAVIPGGKKDDKSGS